MKTLILLAHGSRNLQALKEVQDLAAELEKKFSPWEIRPAFLELAEPSLESVLGELAKEGREITVLPLFLNTGNHVSRDIPALVQEVRQKHPESSIQVLPHLGAHPGYAALVKTIITEAQ